MKWVVCLWIVMVSYSAWAEPKSWMKQTDPNSLGLFAWVSNPCPFTQAELIGRIEGEFLRARIKPNKNLALNLTVNVNCMSVTRQDGTVLGNAVNYEIRYGSMAANGESVLYEWPDYGSMLVGSTEVESTKYFIRTITDDVALSLTDYLKANFQ